MRRPLENDKLVPPPAIAPGESALARCAGLMLDEMGQGALLVDARGGVRLLNHAARLELDDRHPLELLAGHVRARAHDDAAALHDALDAALRRRMRSLLLLGSGDARTSVAVLPMDADALDGTPVAMLLLGRRRVVEHLSVQCFARSRQLTPAETRVLEGLCAGISPAQIAARQQVRISTVRTQIGGIRQKTGTRSIRELMRLVSLLPPMLPALREPSGLRLPPHAAPAHHAAAAARP